MLKELWFTALGEGDEGGWLEDEKESMRKWQAVCARKEGQLMEGGDNGP